MKIDYDGRAYEFAADDLTNKQAVKILQYTGKPSISAWLETCADEKDPAFIASIDAMYWAMLRQNGDDTTPIADVDYKFGRFLDAFKEAASAEAPAEPEPDPTRSAADSAPSPALSSPETTGSAPDGGGSPDG